MNEPQENLTALDMLTLQNAKLTSERDQAIRELARISQENERLKEALQSLYDEQNGPPLIRYQKSWEAAMDKAEQALKGGK